MNKLLYVLTHCVILFSFISTSFSQITFETHTVTGGGLAADGANSVYACSVAIAE